MALPTSPGSTGTAFKQGGTLGPASTGRQIHWGVREHAMAAALNGIAAHGGIRPFGSTFLVFTDYMKPAIRLAAIMRLPVIYVGTHDSIGVGEDGPTHQPIEQLAMLRAIPGMLVLRPADATETVEAWRVAISHRMGPVALVLTRQKLPVLDRASLAPAAGVGRGGYVLWEPPGGPQAILIATGSEVHVALEAAKQLGEEGVRARVVSLPSWELFEAQPRGVSRSVLPRTSGRRWHRGGLAVRLAPLHHRRRRDAWLSTISALPPRRAPVRQFHFTPEHAARRRAAACSRRTS